MHMVKHVGISYYIKWLTKNTFNVENLSINLAVSKRGGTFFSSICEYKVSGQNNNYFSLKKKNTLIFLNKYSQY